MNMGNNNGIDNNQVLNGLIIFLKFIRYVIVFFPVSVFILRIVHHSFHNAGVTNFVNNRLPYCYHPDGGVGQLLLVSFAFIAMYYLTKKLPETSQLYVGGLLGIFSIFILGNKDLYDLIYNIMCFILAVVLIFAALKVISFTIDEFNESIDEGDKYTLNLRNKIEQNCREEEERRRENRRREEQRRNEENYREEQRRREEQKRKEKTISYAVEVN